MTRDLYRQLPKVDLLLQDPRLADLPRPIVVGAARVVLERLRAEIAQGLDELPDVVGQVRAHAELLANGRARPVLNATGVVVHTNLGRAPWAPEVVEAAVAAMGYCNVELELQTGTRGGRLDGVRALLRQLVGAEDAIVVNNCAAAVLLALTALARDREVVVSRGELVEIGGSFRVPDVIASGGARLVEVGTTNRTRIGDYEAALSADTGLLLRVHPSNFRTIGFTEQAPRAALVALGRQAGIPVVEDLGSGCLGPVPGYDPDETVGAAVAAGVDLVTFSGDKLLGGPQAGVIVGRPELVATLRSHPLYRALRVDKVTLAALERTLALHAAGGRPPVLDMIRADRSALRPRAEHLAARLAALGVPSVVDDDVGYVGGGALPMEALPGVVVRVPADDVEALARALRTGQPAIVARIAGGALVLDPRTLPDAELDGVASRVAEVLARMGA